MEAADALNNVFSSTFTLLTTNYTPVHVPEKLSMHEGWNIVINSQVTLQMLKHLKPSKSAGNDNLTPRLLRAAHDVLAGPLTHLFACSITEKRMPKQWKQALTKSKKSKHQ